MAPSRAQSRYCETDSHLRLLFVIPQPGQGTHELLSSVAQKPVAGPPEAVHQYGLGCQASTKAWARAWSSGVSEAPIVCAMAAPSWLPCLALSAA